MAWNWKEIMKEMGISLGFDVLFHEILSKKGAEFAEKALRRITEHDRNGLFVFIADMSDETARENLFRRHRECKGEAGKEDRFVNLLTRLYLTVKDDPSKHWIFTYLGHLSDDDFNQALYFFENDVVKQWFDKLGDFGSGVKQTIKKLDEKGANFFSPIIARVLPIIAMIWNQGGHILRIALFILLAFPLLISLVAFIGSSWVTAAVSLIVFIGILCVVIAMINPIIFGLIAAIPGGKAFLRRVIEVLAIELVFCVYFSIIPVDSIRSMIPVVILLMFAITFLSLAGTSLARTFKVVMSILLIGMTLLFIFSYFRPQTYESLGIWNKRADKKDAKTILDTTTTAVSASPATQATVQSQPEYKQFRTYDLPKGSWTAMIKATLYPNYDVRVTDSTKIRFSDGYEDLITEKGGHGFGTHVGKFQLFALGSNTKASVGEY